MTSAKHGAKAGNEHRDRTHPPGSHPVGAGAGAASAGAAGAALGAAVGGPIGAVVGAAVGAVAGGLGGQAAAEAVNPTIEDVGAALDRDVFRSVGERIREAGLRDWSTL